MAKLTMPNAENCSLAKLNVAAQAALTKQSHIRLTAIRALLYEIIFENRYIFLSRDFRNVS
jgi:hypothetical protein